MLPGFFLMCDALQGRCHVIGNVDVLHGRTDVNEHDAWKVRAGAAA